MLKGLPGLRRPIGDDGTIVQGAKNRDRHNFVLVWIERDVDESVVTFYEIVRLRHGEHPDRILDPSFLKETMAGRTEIADLEEAAHINQVAERFLTLYDIV